MTDKINATLLAESRALLEKLKLMAIHPSHYAGVEAAIEALGVQLPTATADDLAFIARLKIDESIQQRVIIERAIVRKTAQAMLAAGYRVRVHEGEDWAGEPTEDLGTVMASIMSTDEDYLHAFKQLHTGEWRPVGWARFVYGNDGWDVMADNTTNLSDVLKPVDDYADALADL